MRRSTIRCLLLVATLALAGCGSAQTSAPPPTPAPTATPRVIIVIVTATPPPGTATPAEVARPDLTPTPGNPPAAPSAVSTAPATPPAQTTYRLCPAADPATERAIEQFIDARPFRATLSSGSGGCDQLVITPEGGSRTVSGQQSVSLSTDGIQVRIVTENGSTHVSVSPA